MFSDLFDSPWKILIVAVVLIVLFGSKKLPHAARSLGQSMRILKTEVQGLHEDQSAAEAASPSSAAHAPDPVPPPAAIVPRQQPDQQAAQIDALQQRIRDLQRAATLDAADPDADLAAVPAQPQRTQQPG
jgi:sec-independent protein translocase protein TatA